ncbi:alpha/beta hydrolase [Halogeometricum luteum]|uniref:Alpha/beta hydrolase n=1 Tax=Halogeometricum luteum TaxID=2950537 RepID=A0ABU2FYL7_9EURY|nr:alpha/beta hydrolase [Halogeometricum sp. S3BR5-2]MDS0293628.1 alpha/beta hydrolase [Halogeometricum sp. S3BR5-2]
MPYPFGSPPVEVVRDAAFASPPEGTLSLDLYLPSGERGAESEGARRALVVLVHGGGWRAGDKSDLREVAFALAERRFACAVPNFRGSDAAAFPAAIRDVKAAIRWCRANADALGIDPARIAAFGPSTGAHLAVLAALSADDPRFAPDPAHVSAAVSEASDALAAAVGVAGLYNFEHTPERAELAAFLGGPRSEVPGRYDLASPSSHLGGGGPPILLLHGADDDVVPAMASELFYDGLEEGDIEAECVVADGVGHDVLGEQFEWAVDWTEGFLDRHLR